MPELPEVEAARRNLARWAEGRRVVEVRVVDASAVRDGLATSPRRALTGGVGALDALLGAVVAVARRGKRLGWRSGAGAAAVHLGMTGHWVRRPTDEAPPRFARVGLALDDGATLWFTDARRFGCVAPVAPDALDGVLAEGLGPDGLLEPPDGPGLAARMRCRAPIKVALLDQARLAGLGNIHAVEALWRARIHPSRRADALAADEWAALASAVAAQLREAVETTAAEDIVYLSEGAENPFVVYERAGGSCPRCGGSIARTVQAGRSTYACPGCQA